eukprot:c1275_g1_i1.p1 GENE.c1275_g1_i1~~c1275_g1_i1.p1  ORF type:complete len:345 (+),score=61.13 c1275_g1_i1:38-1036(+)
MTININTRAELKSSLSAAGSNPVLIHFSAAWCAPCRQIEAVILELVKTFPQLVTLQIEAEEAEDVAELFQIESVPTCVLLLNEVQQFRIDGVNPPELTQKVTEFCNKHKAPVQAPAANTLDPELNARLAKLVRSAPVMLFMKGVPNSPKCGFSRQIVDLLQTNFIQFDSFDILTDESVRQGLKIFSSWPTFPQLYIDGELIGGLDVVREMVADESLFSLVPTEAKRARLEQRLTKLIRQAPMMLFMKGSPDAPKCGFSREIVGLLQAQNVKFGYFDILTDEEVRQGLKQLSGWPTYPQLYIDGNLIGGLDIVKEQIQDGSFSEIIPSEAKQK